MKKTFLNQYYSTCSLKKLILDYEKTLTSEVSYQDYQNKLNVLNQVLKKRVPDEETYSFLCQKYLPTKHPGGSAGSMALA